MIRIKKSQNFRFLILFLLVLLGILFHGLFSTILLPTFHLDGAFQTASSLFHIHDGDLPVRDFYIYIGTGVVYSLYPIFALFGADLAASGFASYTGCALVLLFSFWLILDLSEFTGRKFNSGVLALVCMAACLLLYPSLPSYISGRLDPGNSLRPIRSFAPFLYLFFIYLAFVKIRNVNLRHVFVGLIAGISFFWSNDYGIPTAMFALLSSQFIAYKKRYLTFKIFLLTSASFVVFLLITLYLVSSGEVVDYLTFNFVDVRKDQYWYYGPWLERSKIMSVGDLWFKVLKKTKFWTLVPIVLSWQLSKKFSLRKVILLNIGLSLYLGGLLASIGGHLETGYFEGYLFWAKFYTTVFISHHVIGYLRKSAYQQKILSIRRYLPSLAFAIIIFALGRTLFKYQDKYFQIKNNPQFAYIEELGGYIGQEWVPHLSDARDNKNKYVIEEYWGLWSAITRKKSQTKVDSIIHALGSQREKFKEQMLKNTDFFITTANNVWNGWNFSANWWFYKNLLTNYSSRQTSPTTYLWKKTTPVDFPEVSCRVENGKNPLIILDHQGPGFFEVKLQYDFSGLSSRTMVLIKNNLNFAAEAEGYLSLNSRESESTFPVFSKDPNYKAFSFKLLTARDSLVNLKMKSCTARLIPNVPPIFSVSL